MSNEIYIFAGGGTGGHLYPGLAVAEELAARRPGAKVVFACSERAIDRRILEGQPYPFVPQPVRAIPRRPWGWPGFLGAWVRSGRLARGLIRDLRPAAVLGLGGFAAAPVVFRARRAGVPVALLNPDAVPGRANRVLAGKADVIFTQFASTGEVFGPRLGKRVRCVGCPVRAGVTGGDRAEAMRHFGLRGDRRTLLVFGGSLLAEALGEAVEKLAGELAAHGGRWQVLHISGSGRAAEIERTRFDKLTASEAAAGVAVRTVGYCERMDLAYAAADLALARAGAVTVAELAATGTPAVLMPYPHHADQHQRLNAGELVRAGAAVICEDRVDAAANAAALREVLLPLMGDAGRLDLMRRAAGKLAGRRFDKLTASRAAGEVAAWLAGAGGQQPVAGSQ